jgi:drug/metabolite transporter (DMT)-like permease
MTKHPSKLDFAFLVLLALLWGSSYALIKIGIETIPPATLTAGRLTIAAVLLSGVLHLRGMSLPGSPRLWLQLLLQSVINLVLPFLLISWGELHVSSGLASILATTAPFFAFAIAAVTGNAARGMTQALRFVWGDRHHRLAKLERTRRTAACRAACPDRRGILLRIVLELWTRVSDDFAGRGRCGNSALGDGADSAPVHCR